MQLAIIYKELRWPVLFSTFQNLYCEKYPIPIWQRWVLVEDTEPVATGQSNRDPLLLGSRSGVVASIFTGQFSGHMFQFHSA